MSTRSAPRRSPSGRRRSRRRRGRPARRSCRRSFFCKFARQLLRRGPRRRRPRRSSLTFCARRPGSCARRRCRGRRSRSGRSSSSSPPAAWAVRAIFSPPAKAMPAAIAVDALAENRAGDSSCLLLMGRLAVQGFAVADNAGYCLPAWAFLIVVQIAASRTVGRARIGRPLRRSAAASGRTTRKPTNFASVRYQMLCGICGSCIFQSFVEPRRAALRQHRRLVGPRSAAAPRADTPWSTGTNGFSSQLAARLLVAVGDVLVEAPFGDVAVHVVQAPGIGLLLADLVVLSSLLPLVVVAVAYQA